MELHPSSLGLATIDESGLANFKELADVSINGTIRWISKTPKSNLQYDVINVSKVEGECKNPLNVAEYWLKVELRRKLTPFVIQTYAPTAAIVMVSWISFLIPFDSYPGRAGLLAGLVLCLINMLLNTLARSPYKGGPDQLSCWLVICIMLVGTVFAEYFLVLFCIRHRKKQVQNLNQKLMDQRNTKEDEGKGEIKSANEILDRYSLLAAPIIFMIVALANFFVSFKFDSPDPDVIINSKEKFKTMCSGLW